MAKNTKAVILAAGLGTRMKSNLPKALHPLRGKPMIEYSLDAVRSAGVGDIICVTGYKSKMVEGFLKGAKIVRQKRPLGSGDALNQTKKILKNFKGDILVLYSDDPLIKSQTLRRLINEHKKGENYCTLLSTRIIDPTGYGRIIRDDDDRIMKIVEETEATGFEKKENEVNAGAYCFKELKKLFSILDGVKNKNKKNEYFLTDVVSLMYERDLKVDSVMTEDSSEALGINSRKDLSIAERILKMRISLELMEKGVTIADPDSTYIDADVTIGNDTVIYPHTTIERGVKIGRNCKIGPYARIRPGCDLKENVEVGNFVELVRAKIDRNTKVKHKAYLGDVIIGKDVNIGAGTITANYDGKSKWVTRIEDGAFIGVGTILIAPVKVGRGAVTGAGAVVTKNHNVPPKAVVVGVPARVITKRGKRR